MARITIAPQHPGRTGLKVVYVAPQAAASGGNAFLNNGSSTLLHVKNGSASPITVTIQFSRGVDGVIPTSRATAIPAGEDWMFNDLTPGDYNQAADNLVYFDCGATVTSITCAVIQ
jgi:hypothetical protein